MIVSSFNAPSILFYFIIYAVLSILILNEKMKDDTVEHSSDNFERTKTSN